ncbi:MAG: TIGR02266 family protein [Deltaproteobacteria bacterium]|nr:TIGR02266 family protein [Deltaproteobacteria bacterium]
MADHRKGPRLDVVLKAQYETEEAFREALIANLGPGGLYLVTDAPFEVGSEFSVEISLPQKRGVIKGRCQVVWVNQVEAENYPKGMGVKFTELPEKHARILQQYLKEIEGS